MRAQCFSSPVQRRYYASSGSLPHIASGALLLVAVFVPLFLAHGSRGTSESCVTSLYLFHGS
jgi:hypothetical protein